MGILRKDYILDRWVYYAVERKKRPREFNRKENVVNSKICLFCPGNEHLTPLEIGRVEYHRNPTDLNSGSSWISRMPKMHGIFKHKNSWKIRWFSNKFPAVELKGNPKIKTKNNFLKEGNAYGMHEIIAETNDHKKQLSDLSIEHIKELLDVYALRIKALSKLKGIKYVSVFKNKGPLASASLIHPHTQVAALSLLPEEVMNEVKAAKKSRKCPYCDIIKLESKGKRKIIENKSIVAFAPFASRFNFEAWIFPKRHVKNITDMYDNELYDMASALKKILIKLKKLNASYNFFLHYAPQGNDLHFHIEVTPRFSKFGGFEYSTGAIINSVMPEDAAKFYRSK